MRSCNPINLLWECRSATNKGQMMWLGILAEIKQLDRPEHKKLAFINRKMNVIETEETPGHSATLSQADAKNKTTH